MNGLILEVVSLDPPFPVDHCLVHGLLNHSSCGQLILSCFLYPGNQALVLDQKVLPQNNLSLRSDKPLKNTLHYKIDPLFYFSALFFYFTFLHFFLTILVIFVTFADPRKFSDAPLLFFL